MLRDEQARKGLTASDQGACDHCGALVFGDSIQCAQCGRFPIRIHQCPRCKCLSAAATDACWKCGRVFQPDGDYL